MICQIKKYGFLTLVFLWVSCTPSQEKKTDTPTSGAITILADESFYPIVKAEVKAFENSYKDASIEVLCQSEDESVMALLNNKAEMIVIGRELTKEEKAFLKGKNVTVRTNKIAIDAIGFIVNKDYPDSLITINQLKAIFSGKMNKWGLLAPYLPDLPIKIIIDKGSSSNLGFIKNKLNLQTDHIQILAAGSNLKVMDLLKANRTGLGVIGANWISDEDDPELKSRLKDLKVLAVASDDEKDRSKFYQPLQAYLGEGKYPLTRSVYIINKTVKAGLSAGFATFILSDPGQRIILKSGLLPSHMPGREIEIKKN
jgi:phosphate transport system substrate-binding protein